MVINFWCVECGQPLLAARANAGRDLECDRCHAVVSVPTVSLIAADDTVDEDEDDEPVRHGRIALEPTHTAPARRGGVLLLISLGLFTLFAIYGFLRYYAAVLAESPVILTTTDALIAGSVLILGAILRILGYGSFRPLARFLGASGRVTVAQLGAVTFTLGSIVIGIQELRGTLWHAVPQYALYTVTLAGFLAEFAFTWVIQQLRLVRDGPRPAEEAVRYRRHFALAVGGLIGLKWTGGIVLAVTNVVSTGNVAAASARIVVWSLMCGLTTAGVLAGLNWLYGRLLWRARD